MTREEYIEFANALKNNYTIDFDKLPEFCDMAISENKTQMIDKSNFDTEQYKTDLQSAYDCGYNKALSENKGDLISRQAVLDEMDKRHAEGDYITKGFIKNLPSVENKGEGRTKGHWIEKGYVGDGNYLFQCSECHCTDAQSKDVKVNYCWHCGADMRTEPYKARK